MTDDRWTRRGFVTGAGALVASLMGRTAAGGEPESGPTGPQSRVVLVRRPEVVAEDGTVDGDLVASMLDEAVMALEGTDAAPAAWRRIVSPDDVVGIKSNEWRHLPTPAALEKAIRDRVVAAGVAPDDVAVDDRGVRSHPVFRRATAIVNVRPLRTHHWSGLGTCLKNMIMFVPRPPEYHGDACAPLGAVWRLPELEGKVRLNVLVMLTPQFHGVGPHSFSAAYTWPYGGLIVGRDPVAVDATGARIIQAQRDRHFGEHRPISPPPHHIDVAAERSGLGVADPTRIEIVRIGDMEDALV